MNSGNAALNCHEQCNHHVSLHVPLLFSFLCLQLLLLLSSLGDPGPEAIKALAENKSSMYMY